MPPQLPPDVLALLGAQRGAATSAQLVELGFAEGRIATAVRRGTLVKVHRGAYALTDSWSAASPRTRHCIRLLLVQQVAPDAIGFGVTAATARGWPVPAVPDLPVVARDVGGGRQLAGAAVRRMPLDGYEIVNHHDLVVTTPELTVLDVAADYPFVDAMMTVDAALRAGVQHLALVALAEQRPVRRRRRKILRAIEAGDPASESALESISRGGMIVAGLPIPLCNVVIWLGHRWYRVDFLWMELGVVGECDGKLKYADAASVAEVLWREKRRHEQIEEASLRIARWGYAEAIDGGTVMVKRVRLAIDNQARAGFVWPDGVRVEVPALRCAATPDRVVAEVRRLQRLGLPIRIIDEARAA